MDKVLLSHEIFSQLRESFSELSLVDLYLFGSIISHHNHVNDVDLLVVYEKESDLPVVKNVLHRIGWKMPLDITYMNREEERELDFVKRQGAVRVLETADLSAACMLA